MLYTALVTLASGDWVGAKAFGGLVRPGFSHQMAPAYFSLVGLKHDYTAGRGGSCGDGVSTRRSGHHLTGRWSAGRDRRRAIVWSNLLRSLSHFKRQTCIPSRFSRSLSGYRCGFDDVLASAILLRRGRIRGAACGKQLLGRARSYCWHWTDHRRSDGAGPRRGTEPHVRQ